jgi:hypothetical protein
MTARDATQIVAKPSPETIMRDAYEKYEVRDIVVSIRLGWSVVWCQFLKGLEKALSLH